MKPYEQLFSDIEAPYDIYGLDYIFDGEPPVYKRLITWKWGIQLDDEQKEGNSRNENVRFRTEIEKFFKQHDFITIDKFGSIRIGDDIVGELKNNEGKGKFTINTSYQFEEKDVARFVKQFNDENYFIGYRFNPLLNGTVNHRIDCEFQVKRSENGGNRVFDISYTGSGTYSLSAEELDRIDNVDNCHHGSFIIFDKAHTITTEDVKTRHLDEDGNVELNYTTRIRLKED